MLVLSQGHSQTASLLLSKGANSAATTLRRLTPLHLSSHEGHLSVARLLLEASAPVDDPDQAGATPLHLASQKGHVGIVRLLLQCGANKECMDERGWAPLHFAVWDGHIAVARTLLHAGANVRVRQFAFSFNSMAPYYLLGHFSHIESQLISRRKVRGPAQSKVGMDRIKKSENGHQVTHHAGSTRFERLRPYVRYHVVFRLCYKYRCDERRNPF